MNPDFSSNNTTNVRFINPPPDPGFGSSGMHSSINAQVKPTIEQLHSGRIENSSNQQNYQPYQSNPNVYQQRQQSNQQLHPGLMHQRPQQNLRFPSNEELIKSQTNSNYNNNSNLHPKNPVPFDGQRIQMTPPIRFPNPQQQIRYTSNNSSGETHFSQSNLSNQASKIESSKAPTDRSHSNLKNFSPSENYKTHVVNDSSGEFATKTLGWESNSSNILNPAQTPSVSKSHTGIKPENIPGPGNTERKLDSVNDKMPHVSREESKTESDHSVESNESKNCDLKSGEKTLDTNKKYSKKKGQQENERATIIKDEGIVSGTVQKNIKFFEKNDTAKTPLRPKTVASEIKEKTIKMCPDVNKSDFYKREFESGVDETPVIHPNLRSIFQVPRKVAKISFLRGNKSSGKFKPKRYFEKTLKKQQIYGRSTLTHFKPGHSYSYKSDTKKTQNIKTYGSDEELLKFFENTKSWRKLRRCGSKNNENVARDEVVNRPTTNGDIPTPKKTPSKLQAPSKKNPPASPVKTPLKSPGTPGTPGAKLLPKTPESPVPPTPLIKKVPMNKIQVGAAPSPNLKTIRSKVGSLANTTHKPGGGNIKIESHKIDLSKVQPRTEAKNDLYKPSGGDKKIQQVKLQWSAKSKVGSLENATYKPGGGDKKIESVKLDFKEKAKSRVGSKDNVKHVPGGGNVKIENQKLEFKAQSKVGSLDNVKHKPGGGDIKIFDDKTYLRQVSGNSSEGRASGTQAYKNLSVEREVRTRSAPGTPGRKTSIQLKKITAIENCTPKIKKTTEVIVTSQTPKDDKNKGSPTKVKVTYSKITSLKNVEAEGALELIKIPAKHNAPVLKLSLSEKDMLDDSGTGKQHNINENKFKPENTAGSTHTKNSDIYKESSESSNLLQSKSYMRNDSDVSKFLQPEMTTQDKIGEIWRERNLSNEPDLFNNRSQVVMQPKELTQTSTFPNLKTGNNHQQFKSLNPNNKSDNPVDVSQQNVYANQNFQPKQLPQNPSFPQNQQRSFLHASLPEDYKISGSQKNEPFTNNPQFWQNPTT